MQAHQCSVRPGPEHINLRLEDHWTTGTVTSQGTLELQMIV